MVRISERMWMRWIRLPLAWNRGLSLSFRREGLWFATDTVFSSLPRCVYDHRSGIVFPKNLAAPVLASWHALRKQFVNCNNGNGENYQLMRTRPSIGTRARTARTQAPM